MSLCFVSMSQNGALSVSRVWDKWNSRNCKVGYFLRGSVKLRLHTHCGLLFLGLENSGIIVVRYSLAWLKHTGKNNRFPFLDILGYLKNTHKNPNLEEWDKSQSGNLVGNSLVGTCLTLPNLGFLCVFLIYPKISNKGLVKKYRGVGRNIWKCGW